MKKWYGVEFDTKADQSVIRYFKEYLSKRNDMRWESCGCYNNTLISVETDEIGLCELNNVIDEYFATAGTY